MQHKLATAIPGMIEITRTIQRTGNDKFFISSEGFPCK